MMPPMWNLINSRSCGWKARCSLQLCLRCEFDICTRVFRRWRLHTIGNCECYLIASRIPPGLGV